MLDGRIATPDEAFDEIITSINACDTFDISVPPKQIMYDIVKASEQWNATGRDALMYGICCVFPTVFDIYYDLFQHICVDMLNGAHPFCKNCKKRKVTHHI